ncbi:MAG: guanylate kinase [Gammaproteobacteria bacterium]|nr:guanylate kinase [Gammaproteobacteria bacterium]
MTSHSDTPKKGRIFIFSAPSGGGKTMLVRRLLTNDRTLVASVSTTTRPPREKEKEGVDYNFVSEPEFQRLVESGEFLEHAHVFGHRYGSRRQMVESLKSRGLDVLFDIDWQGARSIKNEYRDSASFFIVPPSEQELRRRLEERGQDSQSVIDYRMSQAKSEMSHYNEFDYVIVNNDPDEAYETLISCIASIRKGSPAQVPDVSHIVQSMLDIRD